MTATPRLDATMLSDRERTLIQGLADARAEVARIEHELHEARERVGEAQRALGHFYQTGEASIAVEPTIEAWITGVAAEALQGAPDLADDLRATVDGMYVRGQGFGIRGKLIAKASVALRIAEWLEQRANTMRRTSDGTRKTRNDAASISRAAQNIYHEVRKAQTS